MVFVHICPWYSLCGLKVSESLLRICHLLNKFFQPGGETNPAVLCFITLSGYCIHRNGFRNNDFDLKGFLLRRVFRIVPVFILATLLGIVIFWLFGADEKIQGITGTKRLDPLGFLLKVSALHSFFPFYYTRAFQGNAPLVTVGVECWLYAFYPLALLFIKKFGVRQFWFALIFLTILGSACCQFDPTLSGWWHNGSIWGFMIYWYIGVLSVNDQFKLKISHWILAYATLSLVIHFWSSETQPLLELRKILFCFIFGHFLKTIDRRSTNASSIKMIESSYSIYALHAPTIALCLYFNLSILWALVLVAINGYLSFLYIETPIVNYSKSTPKVGVG